MQILHSMTEFDETGCVVALGTFDGVHLGHAKLIRKTVELARAMELPAAALTFDRHPLALINPSAVPPALTPIPQKERLMAALGLDILVVQPFTADFAALEPEAFLKWLCGALNPRAIVVGYNYTFGRRGRGDAALLQNLGAELGYKPVVVEALCVGGAPVSSTRIRALLNEGKRTEAEDLAGHPLAEML